LIVERLTDKHRVDGSLYITLGLGVWPVGTWESDRATSFSRRPLSDEPEHGGSPLKFSPKDFAGSSADWFIAGRVRAPFLGVGGKWWEVEGGDTFDVVALQSKLSRFLDAVDDESPRLLEPQHALALVLEHPHDGNLRYAAAIMDATDMRGPEFQQLVQQLSETWIADPRPATFRTPLLELRAKAGLPEIPLPNPPHTLY
jgi:hypothetical protein